MPQRYRRCDILRREDLTFSVYDTWLHRSSLGGAAQLALAMLVMVFLLLWLERFGRRKQRFDSGGGSKHRPPTRFELGRWQAALALLLCLTPVFVGFVVPGLLLADLASRRLEGFGTAVFWMLSGTASASLPLQR